MQITRDVSPSPTLAENARVALQDLSPSSTGFAVLNTKEFFPIETMRRMLIAEELAPFKVYFAWLTQTLNQSLAPAERLKVKFADLRVTYRGEQRNDFPQWNQDGEYFAAAVSLLGSGTEYLLSNPRQAFTATGVPATLLATRTDYLRTPRGQTLLFSCSNRFKLCNSVAPTLHQSPAEDEDRMFLIVRFELEHLVG